MKAVYLEKKGLLVEKEIPEPKIVDNNQVKIKIKSVGVCGSDVHYWEHGKIGSFIVEKPMILGHEVSGEIVEVGGDVKNFSTGDLVVIEPGKSCGKCELCKTGRYNLCPYMAFYATPPFDGALREYVTFESDYVFKVPENVESEVATLVEPLAVGTFSSNKAGIKLGDKIIVFGAGVIGICCMIAAFESGAQEVYIVDIRDDRLDLALSLGATGVYNAKRDELPEQYFNVAYECTGVKDSLIHAVKILKPGSTVISIGLGAESMQETPIVEMIFKEIRLLPAFRYANVFPASLKIIQKHINKFEKLITHKYNFKETEKAFVTARDNQTAVKVIINFY